MKKTFTIEQIYYKNWKVINGFNHYLISDNGEVYSLKSGKTLKTYGNVYPMVSIYNSKKRSVKRVHRLVAEAFIPNIYNRPEVNHIDGNKRNNSRLNLEWVTKSQNQAHSFKTGLNSTPSGQLNINSKLKEADISCIRNMYSNTPLTYREIADKFNVSNSTISRIINFQRYK